ncbi:MAG: S9 family peptidase [Gammaproteobacteria bacterium]|nr:S9 family peptidase [Gammaproteobacteria bacterium]
MKAHSAHQKKTHCNLVNALVCTFLLCLTSISSAELIVQTELIEKLIKKPQYQSVKISPEGDYFAAMIIHEEKQAVVVLDRKKGNIAINFIHFSGDTMVANFHWVSPKRLLIAKARFVPGFEAPRSTGQLWAVNANGKQAVDIFGYTAKRDPEPVFGSFIRAIDDRKILVLSRPWGNVRGKQSYNTLVQVDTISGKVKKIRKGSLRGSSILVDHNNKPRIEVGSGDNLQDTVIAYLDNEDEWQQLKTPFYKDLMPLGFNKDNDGVYLLGHKKENTEGIAAIWQLSMASGEITKIFEPARVDPSPVYDQGHLIGAWTEEFYPEYTTLDSTNTKSQIRAAVSNVFEGSWVGGLSSTDDYSETVLVVQSDRIPAQFYIFDKSKNKLSKLFDSSPWLAEQNFQSMDAVEFLARDGQAITGYLTEPAADVARPYPLIVIPHGGPHARDSWSFNREHQIFSAHGFGVLSVNFRGSSGFGKAFQAAGYGQWGGTTQFDIIDATRWTIKAGLADPENIHIYGASFGGYSALQSPILAPELFRSAIGYVGVYDLPFMTEKGNVKHYRGGIAYLHQTLATDPDELIAQSPARNVDKLTIPVFIIHGEEDEQAHYGHALKLKKALDKKGHPYRWLTKKGEEHGFYKEENQLELYQAILDFLADNSG